MIPQEECESCFFFLLCSHSLSWPWGDLFLSVSNLTIALISSCLVLLSKLQISHTQNLNLLDLSIWFIIVCWLMLSNKIPWLNWKGVPVLHINMVRLQSPTLFRLSLAPLSVCQDGRALSGVLVCAMFCFCHLFANPVPAMQLLSAKRPGSGLWPSHRR